MTRIIGPRMAEVRAYVEQHPGCPKLHPAQVVGPHGSLRFGYAAVNRAIRAGLIYAHRRESGRYSLYPVRGHLAVLRNEGRAIDDAYAHQAKWLDDRGSLETLTRFLLRISAE